MCPPPGWEPTFKLYNIFHDFTSILGNFSFYTRQCCIITKKSIFYTVLHSRIDIYYFIESDPTGLSRVPCNPQISSEHLEGKSSTSFKLKFWLISSGRAPTNVWLRRIGVKCSFPIQLSDIIRFFLLTHFNLSQNI